MGEEQSPTPDPSSEPRTVTSTTPVEAPPELQVADYRVLQKIGEGGMGEVYLAEQIRPIRRRVALKVIKPGMESREVVARFASERQALGMMSHPCIARVFDAGTTEGGRPFFVMEYVQGVPITEHCDRQRLSTRQRLELFIQVCAGVQHAHQKAIIHRDLKPSNVLVTNLDGDAVPKIIDFGVAKAIAHRLTERTMFTRLGQLIGTPEYMSPEQAEMSGQDIDTRTDIYALGVMLYELLVGALPFESSELRRLGFDQIRRKIREEDPPKPSTRISTLGEVSSLSARNRRTNPGMLSRQLRGDLDWITMKALEKDRNRRYETANELAVDVQRYLNDKPVRASPPSLSYRLRKLVRRNKAAFITASAVIVALLGGLMLATYGFVTASHERDQKERALTEAEAVTEFLAGMLAAVDPGKAGREVAVREVLDQASLEVGTAFDDQPLVEARLRHTIGSTYQALGLLDAAERHLALALEIRKRTAGEHHPDTLTSMLAAANLYHDQGRFQEAEELFTKTLQIRQQSLGDRHPDTQNSMFNLANVYFHQARYAEAAGLHQRILEGRKRSLGEDHPDTLASMLNLASVYWAQGRYSEAEALYVQALAGRKQTLGSEHPETLDSMNNLAALYHIEHRYSEAEALYQEALEISQRVRGSEHPETLVSKGNLAELFADQKRNEEALALLREVVASKRRVLGIEHPSTLYSMGVLARLYQSLGHFDASQRHYLEVLSVRSRVLGTEHPQTLETVEGLLELYSTSGSKELARSLLEELIEMRRRAAEATDASPRAMNAYALLLLSCEPAELRDPQAALEFAVRVNDLTDRSNADYLQTLALAYFRTGDAARAADAQEEALALLTEGASDREAYRRRLAEYQAVLRH